MKTISMELEEYNEELTVANGLGNIVGRTELRTELRPIIDELMNLTRIERRPSGDTWALPNKQIPDEFRKKIRKLMVESKLLRD